MSRGRILSIVAGVGVVGLIAWGATRGLERLVEPPVDSATPPAQPAASGRAHIAASLYYASTDGQTLVEVRRDVELAADAAGQGREILRAQLAPAPKPYVSVIPPGTTLRAFYVTERGEAFVDLSRELSAAHRGGSLAELMTVHALVNAVARNLPAVQRVQILVDGQTVDTIAGHVDVRRPLVRDTSLVREIR
jgi:spore germination protein GerM